MAASTKAILAYRTGKRDGENTDLFIRDLRERILGTPEISTDGFHPYRPAIRDAFGTRVAHGVINKTYSVVDLRKDASHRYSPAAVVAVSREAVIGVPAEKLDQLGGAEQPFAAHVVTPIYPAHKRVLEKARKPRGGGVAVRRSLQPMPMA